MALKRVPFTLPTLAKIFSVQKTLLVFLALLIPAQLAVAQTQILRGRVTVAETQAPLIGALVQVRQTGGAVVTTTTTSGNGTFATQALTVGTYAIRILRIGFRAFDAGRMEIGAAAPTTMNIAWTAIPIPLATRLVKAESSCKISADSGTLIANVWEEAGKALLSSIVAEQSEAPEIERVNFVRFVDSVGVVVAQDVSGESAKSFRAYSSWAPESLAVHGYYRMQGRTYSLVGPDASTLFSDSFVGTHCYSVVDGTGARANEVGLAFTPIKSSKKDRVDIAGTFWVDRNTWGLRSVEFLYEGGAFNKGADPLASRRAGGFVEFGSLATGQWLVTNWRIAKPVFDSGQLVTLGRRQAYVNANPFFIGVDESGGVITKISHNDSTQFEKTLPAILLRVISRDPEISAVGAQIRIGGVDNVFVPDRTGTLRLPGILDGTYTLSATFPSIASFTHGAVSKRISVRGSDVEDTLEAPTMDAVARESCGPDADFTNKSAVFGSFSVFQQKLSGARLFLQSTGPTPNKSGEVNKRPSAPILALTNNNGQFLACNVPRGPVTIRTTDDLSESEQSVTLNATDAMQRVSIDLLPSANFELRLPKATVEFLVLDAINKPVSTKFKVVNALAKEVSLKTDQSGRAILPDQPLGRLTMVVGKQTLASPLLVPGYNLVRFVITKR